MTRSDRVASLKQEIEQTMKETLDLEFGDTFPWPAAKVYMEMTCIDVLKGYGITELPMFDIYIEDNELVVRCHHWPSATVWS